MKKKESLKALKYYFDYSKDNRKTLMKKQGLVSARKTEKESEKILFRHHLFPSFSITMKCRIGSPSRLIK
jgi:hypothetical protein